MRNLIGFMDSGFGGLSIWREVVMQLSDESTIYVADRANCPYGNKSKKKIIELANKMLQFLIDKGCKVIVIACNTITITCLDKFRKDFPDISIIGTVPAVKTAVNFTKNGVIGVLSTSATAKSSYLKDLIRVFAKENDVVSKGTNILVPFIERGDIHSSSMRRALRKILKPFTEVNIDSLVLGCSHFPFLNYEIQKIMGKNVKVIDSSMAIAKQVKRVLINKSELYSKKKAVYNFYTSGDVNDFARIASNLLSKKIENVGRL
ncbi:MAG: glutamate racemase [Candidatus Levybacteria bacterium]|nr:glutamate racemase [Candidatus Levybacteria bacterium]